MKKVDQILKVAKKIPDVSSLLKKKILIPKVAEIEVKILDVSSLVTETKIPDVSSLLKKKKRI